MSNPSDDIEGVVPEYTDAIRLIPTTGVTILYSLEDLGDGSSKCIVYGKGDYIGRIVDYGDHLPDDRFTWAPTDKKTTPVTW